MGAAEGAGAEVGADEGAAAGVGAGRGDVAGAPGEAGLAAALRVMPGMGTGHADCLGSGMLGDSVALAAAGAGPKSVSSGTGARPLGRGGGSSPLSPSNSTLRCCLSCFSSAAILRVMEIRRVTRYMIARPNMMPTKASMKVLPDRGRGAGFFPNFLAVDSSEMTDAGDAENVTRGA